LSAVRSAALGAVRFVGHSAAEFTVF